MNLERIFDDLTLLEGGRLDSKSITPEAFGYIQNLLRYSCASMPKDIIVDVIDNGHFGALARKSEHQICGIHFGLIIFIGDLFHLLAKGFDEKMEFQFSPTLEAELQNMLPRLKKPDLFSYKSWNPQRNERGFTQHQLAIEICCTVLAIHFVVSHERAHLELRHLEFIAKKLNNHSGSLSLNETELANEFVDSSDLLDLRALEFMADQEAAEHVTMSMFAMQQTHEPGVQNAMQLIANPHAAYGLFLFSSQIIMYCFWLFEGGVDRVDHAHPHPEVRHFAMMRGFQSTIQRLHGENTEPQMEIARNAFVKVERPLGRLYDILANNPGAAFNYLKRAHTGDDNAFHDHVAVVRKQLRSFT